MNISPWTIYWLTRLEPLKECFGVIALVISLVLVMALLLFPIVAEMLEDAKINIKPWLKATLAILGVSVLGYSLCPTTKEAAAMVIIPAVANNEDFQKLGADLPKLAREWLEELHPAKKAEK